MAEYTEFDRATVVDIAHWAQERLFESLTSDDKLLTVDADDMRHITHVEQTARTGVNLVNEPEVSFRVRDAAGDSFWVTVTRA